MNLINYYLFNERNTTPFKEVYFGLGYALVQS